MRPAAISQSFARAPLDELLGTPANVRLLRVLSDQVSGPVAAPEAAERAQLTAAGARRALKRLAATGFVERIGTGRSQAFRLRAEDPLVGQIVALFQAERYRYETLLKRLARVFDGLPEVHSAWLEAPPDDAGQPLHLGVVADPAGLSQTTRDVRRQIMELERAWDLTIEVHPFSRADAPDVDWSAVTLVGGHPLLTAPPGGAARSHQSRTARALRLSHAVAELVDKDASLILRAKRHLVRLLSEDQGAAAQDLREWLDILEHYSPQRIREFLVADTPRARRLRQSSPFFAVLTPDERDELVEEVDGA
jgi:hypothetical protein